MDLSVFGKRLKEARTDNKISQKELSALAGVSTVMISSYERSDEKGGNPSLANAAAIANALNVSLDWLCGLTDKRDVIDESSKIDTDSFLRSFIAFLDRSNIEKMETYSSNGVARETYTPDIIQGTYAYDFITEYLEVQPVLKGNILPEPIKETVIEKIISKYEDKSIDDLFEPDKVYADELPF